VRRLDQLLQRVGRAGYRMTSPRRAILEQIAACEGQFTASDVLQRVAAVAPEIGRATVFRTIELLLDLGALERVHTGDERRDTYVVCHDGHHHHLVCSVCGTVAETADCTIGEAVAAMARQAGYEVEQHWLEIVGRCPRCAAASATQPAAPARGARPPRRYADVAHPHS
jgi:Fur family ferric uptake transcriptional regulator